MAGSREAFRRHLTLHHGADLRTVRHDGQDLDHIVVLEGRELDARRETLQRRARHEGRRSRATVQSVRVSAISAATARTVGAVDDEDEFGWSQRDLCTVDLPGDSDAAGSSGDSSELPRPCPARSSPNVSVSAASADDAPPASVSHADLDPPSAKARRLNSSAAAEDLGDSSWSASAGSGDSVPGRRVPDGDRRRMTSTTSVNFDPRPPRFTPEQLATLIATVEAASPGIDMTVTASRVAGYLGVAVDSTDYAYIVTVLRAVRHLDSLSAEATDTRGRILLQLEPSGIVALHYFFAELQARMRRRADMPDYDRDVVLLALPSTGPERPDLEVYFSDDD